MLEPSKLFEFEQKTFIKSELGTQIPWVVPSHLAYFEGHFPGKPVLPAVGIIDASLVGIERILGKKVQMKAISSAKFMGLIEPGLTLEILLNSKDQIHWEAKWLHSVSKETLAMVRLEIG